MVSTFKIFPRFSAGPQKLKKVIASKTNYEKFGLEILILRHKMDMLVPNTSRTLLFDHYIYNFKSS